MARMYAGDTFRMLLILRSGSGVIIYSNVIPDVVKPHMCVFWSAKYKKKNLRIRLNRKVRKLKVFIKSTPPADCGRSRLYNGRSRNF